VDIFYKAKEDGKYTSYLNENSALPMMYMEDAIRATLELMEAHGELIKIRSAYNLSGCSFTPKELADEIRKHIPEFQMSYQPDFRQEIADSWPNSIDDSQARKDWGWREEFSTAKLTEIMIENVQVS
jgi:nucleoside-diphosphate-sugar epimerase